MSNSDMKFLLIGVGGQGTLLASNVVAQVGVKAGFDVKKAEVHGMAQRGGSVSSHVRWAEKVHSPLVGQGEVDYLVAFEKLEACRWAHYLHSKQDADRLAFDYWRETGLPITVLRLGILYGPGGRTPGRGLLQLGPLRFTMGNGRNTLPFTYVGNAVDCMLLAAIKPAAVGQVRRLVDPSAKLQVAGFDQRHQFVHRIGPVLRMQQRIRHRRLVTEVR